MKLTCCKWCLGDLELIEKHIVKDRKTKKNVVRYVRYKCKSCGQINVDWSDN